MKLVLQRQTETAFSTIGELTIEGKHAAWTLERPAPQYKADFHRIQAGTFPISLYDSPHFKRLMPLLDVPGHSFIEIHYGNYPANSRGCILVGKEKGKDAIFFTVDKFNELFPVIEAAVNAEGCQIEVLDAPVANTHDEVADAAAAL